MGVSAEWDVFVVGAGPAGSRAAAVAASEGARTLLIEASKSIGQQPHCGEYVHGDLFEEYDLDQVAVIQEVDEAELLIIDLGSSGASSSESLTDHVGFDPGSPHRLTANGAQSIQKVLWRHPLATRGRMIDRARFDRDLARHAACRGATVLSSTRLVRRDGGAWIVRCRGEELALHAKSVVAADGAASTVASSMGMERLETGLGVQVEVPIARPGNKIHLFFSRSFFGGYGWLFPKGKAANVGIGVVPRKGVNAATLLRELLDWLCHAGMILPGILAHYQGMIPVSGIRPRLVEENVIFCGDAAGLADPVTGGGIVQAVVSGDHAGRAAAKTAKTGKREHLQDYQDTMTALYGEVSARACARRRSMMSGWDDLPFHQVVRAAFLDIDGPLVSDACISSYLRRAMPTWP